MDPQYIIKAYSHEKEEEQTRLIADDIGIPYINLRIAQIDDVTSTLIPVDIVTKYSIIAFSQKDTTIKVATQFPYQNGLSEAMTDLGRKLKVNFEPYFCSKSSFDFAYEKYKRIMDKIILKEEEKAKEDDPQSIKTFSDLQEAIKRATTTNILELILVSGYNMGASDVHFEPQIKNVRVRFRIDGELRDAIDITQTSFSLLVSRIKNVSHLKLNIKTQPQDGSFSMILGKENVDFRVSVTPSVYGETIVLRILPNKAAKQIEELGLEEDIIAAIKRNIAKRTGLILLTGPTGSGKTTTLYAVLGELNKPDKKIITIEDPVEYKMVGAEQIQISSAQGFGFAEALRAVLRQDPDIVLVGEIRDKETAEIAINASLTGHLVLSTLHTNNAPGVFARLIEMEVPKYLLADAIILVIAQRLIKKICQDCQGKGCGVCFHTGYKGRTVIAEYLEPDQDFANLIKAGATLREFKELYRQKGYKSIDDMQVPNHK